MLIDKAIIAPNKWYDQVREPWRFLMMIVLWILGFIFLGDIPGLVFMCVAGLYRLSYHMIMNRRRVKKHDAQGI